MKSFKKVTVIFIIAVFALSLLFGCDSKEKEAGYFKYRIINNQSSCTAASKRLYITGLTEEGANQRVLIVPKEINGIKVNSLNYTKGMWSEGSVWKSEVLEKVVFYENYPAVYRLYNSCLSLKSVVIVDYKASTGHAVSDFWDNSSGQKCYISPIVYFEQEPQGEQLAPANIVFYFNYEDSDNYGVYWLDNVDYGGTIEIIPENPIRTGYEFKGWFKEKECVNEWNFNSDQSSQELLDDEGNIIYQQIKLFAKWI